MKNGSYSLYLLSVGGSSDIIMLPLKNCALDSGSAISHQAVHDLELYDSMTSYKLASLVQEYFQGRVNGFCMGNSSPSEMNGTALFSDGDELCFSNRYEK